MQQSNNYSVSPGASRASTTPQPGVRSRTAMSQTFTPDQFFAIFHATAGVWNLPILPPIPSVRVAGLSAAVDRLTALLGIELI